MGIFGAAFATGLSPIISMLILITYFIKKKNSFRLTMPDIVQTKGTLRKILANGIPPFLTEAASGVVMFLFNFIILKISGNVGVAAFGVISVISLVVISLYTGLSQGMQPLISQNHGIGNKSAVKTLFNYSLITSIILSAVVYGIIFFNAPTFVSIFNKEQDLSLAQYAIPGLKLYFAACPFIGFNIVQSYIFYIHKSSYACTDNFNYAKFSYSHTNGVHSIIFVWHDRCMVGIPGNRNTCIYLCINPKAIIPYGLWDFYIFKSISYNFVYRQYL